MARYDQKTERLASFAAFVRTLQPPAYYVIQPLAVCAGKTKLFTR
jgi:hypothetical protein